MNGNSDQTYELVHFFFFLSSFGNNGAILFRLKIQENHITLKELEALHMKYMKRQEVCSLYIHVIFYRLDLWSWQLVLIISVNLVEYLIDN